MKIWLDDQRKAPDGYNKIVNNIEDAKELILNNEIELLSIDNDLGHNVAEGFKLIDWIEEQLMYGKIGCFNIQVHSANPVRYGYINNVIKRINNYCCKTIMDYEWFKLQKYFPMFCDYVEETYAEYNNDNIMIINFNESFYDLLNIEFGVDITYGYIWSQLQIIEEILMERFEKM